MKTPILVRTDIFRNDSCRRTPPRRGRPAAFLLSLPLLVPAPFAFAQALLSDDTQAAAGARPAAPVSVETRTQGTKSSALYADDIVVLDKLYVSAGFRGSLAAAAQMKQSAPLIADIVAAEDIGKLPDMSIADALGRLPGIATQRLNGRAQAISIRGLTGDFTTGLLNGRQQVTTNDNRTVEFDQYPAELLSGAVVYKTTEAQLIGQGLAGTVDMRTVRPLSQGARSVAASAFVDWTQYKPLNPESDRAGQRFTFSYIDQFLDNTLGIAIGVSTAKKPGQGEQWNSWGYPTVDASPTDKTQVAVLGGAKPFVRSSDLDRKSVMGVVEYRPNDWFHATLDLYGSHFKEAQILRGIEIPLQWGNAKLQPGFTVEDGIATKSVFTDVYGVIRNDGVWRKDDLWSAGLNLTFGGGASPWTVVLDAGYSRVHRVDTVLETYSGAASNKVGTPDTLTVLLSGKTGATFMPTLNYLDTNLIRLSGPQGWGSDVVPGGQAGFLKDPTVTDQLGQYTVSVERKMKWWIFNKAQAGVSYTPRKKEQAENGYYLAFPGGATSAPLPKIIGVTNLGFMGIPGILSYNPRALLDDGAYVLTRNPNADVVSTDWVVDEKVAIVFAQLGIETKIAGRPLLGGIGAQLVYTDQHSTGLEAIGTGNFAHYTPAKGGSAYYNFIPSLNLIYRITNRQNLRFSVARQLARQSMNDMRSGKEFRYNPDKAANADPRNGPWSANSGNPKLRPWLSDSVDLSYEWYFPNNMGYVSLAGFYKNLRTYTYNQSILADFTGLPYAGPAPATFQGLHTRPVNGEGGSLKGFEATISVPSEIITTALPGLGIIIGGAYTGSKIHPEGPGGSMTIEIPGLSKWVASATIYYERAGFSARVSNRYRDKFRANVYTFGPRGQNYRTIKSENVVDAQIGYEFKKGMLKGLSIIVQAYNLTDEPLVTYDGDPRLVIDYQRYGASFSAGVMYKF